MIKDLEESIQLDPDYSNLTFKDYSDIYLEYIKLHMEYNTYSLYQCALKHFKNLNDLKMSDIKTIQIQQSIDEMIRKGFMYQTISTYYDKLKAMFNDAVDKYNIISKSPAKNISIKCSKEKNEKKALTESELKDLLSKTKNIKYKVIFALAGMCGLRFGEICGLTWDKVDFSKKTVTINIQWKRLEYGIWGYGELKTKNSYRSVPLPPYTEKILKEYKSIVPIDISNRIIVYKQLSGVDRRLRECSKKCGYDISVHELRHTYATTLIANGVDFKTTAQLLGHDVKQTMKTYSHVTSEMMDNAINVLNDIF